MSKVKKKGKKRDKTINAFIKPEKKGKRERLEENALNFKQFLEEIIPQIKEGDLIGDYEVIQVYKHFILTINPHGDKESLPLHDAWRIITGQVTEVGMQYGYYASCKTL